MYKPCFVIYHERGIHQLIESLWSANSLAGKVEVTFGLPHMRGKERALERVGGERNEEERNVERQKSTEVSTSKVTSVSELGPRLFMCLKQS